MYRIAKVAEILDLHPATVYELVASGKLHCHRIGPRQGAIRISQEQIDDYLRGVCTTPEPVKAVYPGREAVKAARDEAKAYEYKYIKL